MIKSTYLMRRQPHGQLRIQPRPVDILEHQPVLLEAFQRGVQFVQIDEVDGRLPVPDAREAEVHGAPAYAEVCLK